jgi:large conductance mechanosensitive channel
MSNTLNEFKTFINKGNVVALGVGVIMATEFGKIVNSLVEDIIMPPIGKILGNVDFSNLYLSLSSAVPAGANLVDAKKAGPVIAYGNFITLVISFIIVSFVVFQLVKAYSKVSKTDMSA